MAKPQPIRIPSDDFIMTVRGREYRPHEGESVDIIPFVSVAEARAVTLVQQLGADADAIRDDPGAKAELDRIGTEQLIILTNALSARLIAWTWTDWHGNPLPQPNGDPEVLMALSTEELFYLLSLNEESALGKLNGSRDLASTSSGTKSSRSARTASRNGTHRPA